MLLFSTSQMVWQNQSTTNINDHTCNKTFLSYMHLRFYWIWHTFFLSTRWPDQARILTNTSYKVILKFIERNLWEMQIRKSDKIIVLVPIHQILVRFKTTCFITCLQNCVKISIWNQNTSHRRIALKTSIRIPNQQLNLKNLGIPHRLLKKKTR